MARDFAQASSQALEVNSAPISAYPYSMSMWFYNKDDTGDKWPFQMSDRLGDNGIQGLRLDDNEKITAISYDGTTFNGASTAPGSVTNNTWQHAGGVWTSATSRAAFVNGGGKGTNTTNIAIGTLNTTSIGRLNTGTPGGYHDGYIAECGIWNVALTDAEMAILGLGVSPLLVRPESLVFYVPLVRDDDNDLVGGLNLAEIDTPGIIAHTRVIYPSSIILGVPATAVDVVVLNNYLSLMGVGS